MVALAGAAPATPEEAAAGRRQRPARKPRPARQQRGRSEDHRRTRHAGPKISLHTAQVHRRYSGGPKTKLPFLLFGTQALKAGIETKPVQKRKRPMAAVDARRSLPPACLNRHAARRPARPARCQHERRSRGRSVRRRHLRPARHEQHMTHGTWAYGHHAAGRQAAGRRQQAAGTMHVGEPGQAGAPAHAQPGGSAGQLHDDVLQTFDVLQPALLCALFCSSLFVSLCLVFVLILSTSSTHARPHDQLQPPTTRHCWSPSPGPGPI